MTGLLIAAIVLVVLAIALLYRIFRGPTAADRIAALDQLALVLKGLDPSDTALVEAKVAEAETLLDQLEDMGVEYESLMDDGELLQQQLSFLQF